MHLAFGNYLSPYFQEQTKLNLDPPNMDTSLFSPLKALLSFAMDPYKRLQISLNLDGSLTRHAVIPLSPPNSDARTLSKDITLNKERGTFLRVFLPNITNNNNTDTKLPIILYFHGGGFILFSAATSFIHASCSQRAAEIPAIVISVDYRLAPEHRLPAAYDDAVDALLWVRDGSDPWLLDHADFSSCFIMGSSAGANIAFHLGLRTLDLDLGRVRIGGLILNQPYFGGEARTKSEAASIEDKILPLSVNDLMWELSLPIGSNRDHEYCNPMNLRQKEKKKLEGLTKVLLKGYVGDPLYDRQKEFAKMMEENMVKKLVVLMEDEGFHGIEMLDSTKAKDLMGDCRRFIYGDRGGEN